MADLVQKIEAVEFGDGARRYVVGYRLNDGDPTVKDIGEHQPAGPGDVWMYNVIFEDGSATRVFNQTRVFFGKPQPAKELVVPPKKKLIV